MDRAKNPEVARKLYPAIRRVFEYARIRLRDGMGGVGQSCPLASIWKAIGFKSPAKLSPGQSSVPSHERLPSFIADLRARDAIAARALKILILTNVRTDAVLKVKWDELILDQALWLVPLANLEDSASSARRRSAFRYGPGRSIAYAKWKRSKSRSMCCPAKRQQAAFEYGAPGAPQTHEFGREKWVDVADKRPITAHGFRATFRTGRRKRPGFRMR